jgi:hypothetical protein
MRAVRHAADDHAAGAADALAAVAVELDRFLALADEVLVEDVEHLEERHLLLDAAHCIIDEPALGLAAGLAPDLQVDCHAFAG